MSSHQVAKILAIVIFFTGFGVMIGWVFDVEILKSIFHNLSPIKPTVALSFMASGAIVYFLSERQLEKSFAADIFLPPSILLILLLVVSMFTSVYTGVDSGIDNFFIQENLSIADFIFSDKLSVATMIGFIFIALAGILGVTDLIKIEKQLLVIGVIVGFLGGFAVLGYLLDIPFLYYEIGLSAATAYSSAILFILSGLAIILCKNTESEKNL